MAEVNDRVREVAYVAVGLGVLGFQRAQARRRQMAAQLRELERRIEPTLEGIGDRVDPVLDQLAQHLPEQAQAFLSSARRAARDSQEQFRARRGGGSP